MPLAVSILLAAAVLFLYGQTGNFDFARYDDEIYIIHNSRVSDGMTLDGVRWAFTTYYAANWHPLTWLSHMLDGQVHGLDPGGHHWTNVLLHMLNSLLLFYVFRAFTGNLWPSALLAVLFAVHPLQVESVAWISERKNLLCMLFGLLSMRAYLAYVRSRRREAYLLCGLFLCLGLMAKAMIVTLPFVFLLLDVWPLGRLYLPKAGLTPYNRRFLNPSAGRTTLRLVAEKLPFFVPVLLISWATLLAQSKGGAVVPLNVIPVGVRAANAVVSYGQYLLHTFWPVKLAIFYPHPEAAVLGAAVFWAGLGLTLATVVFAVFLPRAPYLIVGWLWYLGTLVPMIGLVQVGHQAMADRYAYLPHIGIFIIISWGLHDLVRRHPGTRPWVLVLVLAALTLLGVRTWFQAGHWKNGKTLFENALRVNAKNHIAHNAVGVFLLEEGKTDAAEGHFREAIAIRPDYREAMENLSWLLMRRGKRTEGLAQYRRLLELMPLHPEGNRVLGKEALVQGRVDDAMLHFARYLRARPKKADAYLQVGFAMLMKGHLEQAKLFFSRALEIDPNNRTAKANLDRLRQPNPESGAAE